MHPVLTYTLLGLLGVLFAFGWWLDGRPDDHRLARYRKFSLVLQIAALFGAVALLRPGRGTHEEPSALAAAIGNGTPALIDVYSNY
jgi:hypothetical protein